MWTFKPLRSITEHKLGFYPIKTPYGTGNWWIQSTRNWNFTSDQSQIASFPSTTDLLLHIKTEVL